MRFIGGLFKDANSTPESSRVETVSKVRITHESFARYETLPVADGVPRWTHVAADLGRLPKPELAPVTTAVGRLSMVNVGAFFGPSNQA
jgi:hypothetical protein